MADDQAGAARLGCEHIIVMLVERIAQPEERVDPFALAEPDEADVEIEIEVEVE